MTTDRRTSHWENLEWRYLCNGSTLGLYLSGVNGCEEGRDSETSKRPNAGQKTTSGPILMAPVSCLDWRETIGLKRYSILDTFKYESLSSDSPVCSTCQVKLPISLRHQ